LFPDFGHLNPTPLSRDGTPRRPATDPREAERRHARLHAGARARIVSTVGLSRPAETDTPRASPARWAKASAGTPARAGSGAPPFAGACRASCSCR